MKFSVLSLTALTTPLRKVLAHYTMISFLLIMATLILCVFTIQQILNTPSDDDYRTELEVKRTKASFDKTTIKKVEKLRTVDDGTSVSLPTGHYNPFTVR